MSVRWKPLLILSGLFVMIAIVGLVTMAFTLMPNKASDIVILARAERTAKRYENSKLQYERALQLDGKNASIHEELAAMLGEWAQTAPRDKVSNIEGWRIGELAQACRYGATLKAPRKALLTVAMEQDDPQESLRWANELIALDPHDLDALYVLAYEALETRSPNFADVKRLLGSLEEAKASPVRLAWIKARLGDVSGDLAARTASLETSRGLKLPSDANSTDLTALFRMRALDVESTDTLDNLPARVTSLRNEAKVLLEDTEAAPNRVMRLSLVLEKVEKTLTVLGLKSAPEARKSINSIVDAIDQDVESIFQKSLSTAGKTKYSIYLTYADHLRFRGKSKRCLEVVDEALKLQNASSEVSLGLHAVAVEAALADASDKDRHKKAEPHIAALIASSTNRYQGLGHLFQGAVELEQSGLVAIASRNGGPVNTATPTPKDTETSTKLRSSALRHLKAAAEQLPDVVEAQARYGVALVLSQEPNLGRQYLQNALKLGPTDPQYQIWAAWSMVQAGYPEEAVPIVNHLMTEVTQGRISAELGETIHLLNGEINQSRRSPEDLKQALAEYDRSYSGKTAPSAVQLRMAQIEVQLGQAAQAITRLQKLRAEGNGSPGVEQFLVLTLLEQNKKAEALDTLSKAKILYPTSEELVGLESALLIKDGKPEAADRVVASFLEKDPHNLGVVLMRAQILAEQLDKPNEARKLLSEVAETSDNSAPFVQLALLDLKAKDYEKVAVTVSRIRGRWKEAAAADLLEAQMALEQGKLNEALSFLDTALKKDPGNKLVQFWKAQVDSRLGASTEAAKTFEQIASGGSTKELESGLSLSNAAQSALANLSYQHGDIDLAIRQFEGLRSGGIGRADRWQLIKAYVTKSQWPTAKREIGQLLNDNKNPASLDERVRAANYYRENNEPAAATDQLNYVLSINPAHASAVVTRAFMYADLQKPREAITLIRKAINTPSKETQEKSPAVFYLMLAALENTLPPLDNAGKRTLDVLDEGLAVRPKSPELVQAKYRLLLSAQGPKEARQYVEQEAKGDQEGALTKLLAAVCRDQGDLESAEGFIKQLIEKKPNDSSLAQDLVRLTAQEAAKASDQSDRSGEQKANEKTAALIKQYREKYPNEVSFAQEDCELAFRKGDISKALAITKEIDSIAKGSSAGPLLRARLYTAQSRIREASEAYGEALARNPNQLGVRILLGQTSLQLGQIDEAVRQAKLVLEADRSRADAILLEARALAATDPASPQVASNRTQAIEHLQAALQSLPTFSAAYHQIAEIQLMNRDLKAATATLEAAVKNVPEDAVAVSQLIEILALPTAEGVADKDRLARAETLASQLSEKDKKGNVTLAAAIGFHKADQLDQALKYVEQSSKRMETPALHLNFGDILLSKAERTKEKSDFEKALVQYDIVLKSSANSVEAINNKAWILHSYLGQSKEALTVATDLLARVDPSTLPGEFFDTLGAIQESQGALREAEDSYSKGLRKSPDHPVLNYHMGKLIVANNRRSDKARDYLEKALAGRKRLSPEMADEASTLIKKIRAN